MRAYGEDLSAAADRLLLQCGTFRPDERVIVVCDKETRSLGTTLAERAKRLSEHVSLLEIAQLPVHGAEPPDAVADAMKSADLILGLTTSSMAHTQARKRSTDAGARYLSLPDYSAELLCDRSMRADFRGMRGITERLAKLFTTGRRAVVTSELGTDLRLDIGGRTGNCCPGYVEKAGELGSPPDIEANVSPIETKSQGIIVVDGSVPCPEIGLLSHPIILRVDAGRIVAFEGGEPVVRILRRLFARLGSEKAYVLAEFGVGLNDMSELTGKMLTDEGASGTAHFGFGSNATVGGTNDVPFHLDFVFRSPSVDIDGRQAIKNGQVMV